MKQFRYIFFILILGLLQVDAAVLNVPTSYGNLQSAISAANSGDTIELENGTYSAPTDGFRLENNTKNLTIQAVEGATVTIDGGGNKNLIWFGYTPDYRGIRGTVLFKDLSFLNGYSNADGIAGAVTMLYGATAKFKNCTFQSNTNNAPNTGGGAILIGDNSTAYILDSTFDGNSAKNEGGAISIKSDSVVYVHNSKFISNRTNLPEHRVNSAGGAIHVGDSQLKVSNSRFENNQAGYVGGAIYAIGTYEENWEGSGVAPGSNIVISNCTFVTNNAERDSGVSFSYPTEAGAVHVEDKTLIHIYASRFEKNYAMDGGAVNVYRANAVVENSVFRGNYATGAVALSQKSIGGTFSIISNDANDITTNYGAINRPSGSLTLSDSYVQGRYDSIATVADVGGCFYASGDANRLYGQNGVGQDGTEVSNRANITLSNVAFNDCDVVANGIFGSGAGGAIAGDLANIVMDNSMIINSDASGTYDPDLGDGSGGGIWIANRSVATLSSVTFAKNSAEVFGGGVFASGSELEISNSMFIQNSVSTAPYGAALFTTSGNYAMTGNVADSIFSNNTRLAIFDDDRADGPSNALVYNNNSFFENSDGNYVFQSSLAGKKDVSGLNSLIVTRNVGTTDKSTIANTQLASQVIYAKLLAVPSKVYDSNAQGDSAPPTVSYLVYGWSGDSATLNSIPLTETTGFGTTDIIGTNMLHVNGSVSADSLDTVSKGTTLNFSFENDKPIAPVIFYLLM